MPQIIDRRLNPKNKSAINRERFLRRYRRQIQEAVAKSVRSRSVTNVSEGEKVNIPSKDIGEPTFHHGRGGVWEAVHPGNDDFVAGDTVPRPRGGSGDGSGSGAASDSGEGEDDFSFTLSKQEFLNYLFDELELPNLVKEHLSKPRRFDRVRAGFTSDGVPTNLHIVRSLKGAIGRRIALAGPLMSKLKAVEQELRELRAESGDNEVAIAA